MTFTTFILALRGPDIINDNERCKYRYRHIYTLNTFSKLNRFQHHRHFFRSSQSVQNFYEWDGSKLAKNELKLATNTKHSRSSSFEKKVTE